MLGIIVSSVIVALVVTASHKFITGDGEVLAKQLATLGAKIIISARNESELERVKKQIAGKHGPEGVEILPLDLSSGEDAIKEVVEKAVSLFGGAGVDYMIHNAAFERPKSTALDVPEASLKATLDVNVMGPISLTRLLLPHMLKRGRGHFVVMSSAAGKVPAPGQAVYSASKFALNGYFHSLRSEKLFYQKGIMVTVVCPGPIETSVAPDTSTSGQKGVKEKRVSSERCAELTLVAASHGLKEAWISHQPVLAVMYLVQYMPSVGFWLMDKVDNHVPENVEETLEPPAKKNKRLRSPVWEHFDKITVNGKQKAECHYCKNLLSGESSHGTRHLHDHLNSCKKRKQPDIQERLLTGNSKSNLSTYVYNEKDGRTSLAKMVILHEYPLSIVEHVGFRNFTKTLQPLFNCPSRNTLKSDILKLYNQQKDQVIKDIETNKSRVTITTDMWTSGNQKKGFMAIIGHYIDNDWTLKSKILRFLYVPCPHTSEVLTNVLMEALMEWNVDTNLSTITLDNCSTNDKLIDMVKDKSQASHLIKDGAHIHMRCCAHILNLIVKVGLNAIKAAIDNVRESVSYWTATPKRVEKFEETCRQLKITYSKTLGLDCQTRWNATFLMLKTALMYKDVFTRLKQRGSHYKTLPSPLEWENARIICKKLEKLRGAKYPVMQAIARDILAIPVSSVASESAFSTSGRLISPHRSRLRPDTIEALMCAQSWLWEIVNKDEGKPFTSDNNATIFDDYDTDGEGEGEGKDQELHLVVLVKGFDEWS
ncbi:dehydrogenase/reductase SDR family member 7 isoform X1 [Tanacetum coccineum]